MEAGRTILLVNPPPLPILLVNPPPLPILLVNPPPLPAVPGRTTAGRESEWLADLLRPMAC